MSDHRARSEVALSTSIHNDAKTYVNLAISRKSARIPGFSTRSSHQGSCQCKLGTGFESPCMVTELHAKSCLTMLRLLSMLSLSKNHTHQTHSHFLQTGVTFCRFSWLWGQLAVSVLAVG